MEFHKEDSNTDWTKEDGGRDKPFDFDAFLKDENYSLDDQVTRVLGGRELLEPDAFGGEEKYVPSRRVDAEHGRHELRPPEPTALEGPPPEPIVMKGLSSENTAGMADGFHDAQEPASDPKPWLDPSDPRYAAPARPQIVVAEPRAKVVIEPDVAEKNRGGKKPRKKGMSEALKWVIAALVVVAILGAVGIKLMGGLGGIKNIFSSFLNSSETAETQPDNQNSQSYTVTVTPTPKPTQAPSTPTPAPEVTPEPAIATYNITPSASEGGSISPSNVVSVREGGDATFSIFPAEGYSLNRLVVDGVSMELEGTYTFRGVMRDHTIYVEFLKDPVMPDPVTPEPITPEPITPEPITPEPITPEPITPEPITPEPITPEPITPEPITPEPAVPEPTPEPPPEAVG